MNMFRGFLELGKGKYRGSGVLGARRVYIEKKCTIALNNKGLPGTFTHDAEPLNVIIPTIIDENRERRYSLSMKKVLCTGLVVCDIPLGPVTADVFNEDHYRINPPVFRIGGDAANTAITLSKLGIASSMCGFVGNDITGDFIIKELSALGVDVSGMNRHPEKGTATSYILIEPGGERHFLVSSSMSSELSDAFIPERLITKADLVYLGSAMHMKRMDNGGAAALFRKAHSLGKITAADFGAGDGCDDWLSMLAPMLEETDVALPSYREAKKLTGRESLDDIRDCLSRFGVKLLVVKLGAEGSYVTDFSSEWKIPAYGEFKAVDTTGAGDSFAGGLVAGLLHGWTAPAAARFATAVAGFNVTKTGATAGVPDFQTAWEFVTKREGAGEFSV
jgi:sugar/nucleoside kinase (ribokinase family)